MGLFMMAKCVGGQGPREVRGLSPGSSESHSRPTYVAWMRDPCPRGTWEGAQVRVGGQAPMWGPAEVAQRTEPQALPSQPAKRHATMNGGGRPETLSWLSNFPSVVYSPPRNSAAWKRKPGLPKLKTRREAWEWGEWGGDPVSGIGQDRGQRS